MPAQDFNTFDGLNRANFGGSVRATGVDINDDTMICTDRIIGGIRKECRAFTRYSPSADRISMNRKLGLGRGGHTRSVKFGLRALAARKMLRERKICCRHAAEEPVIHADSSEDQRSNSQDADCEYLRGGNSMVRFVIGELTYTALPPRDYLPCTTSANHDAPYGKASSLKSNQAL